MSGGRKFIVLYQKLYAHPLKQHENIPPEKKCYPRFPLGIPPNNYLFGRKGKKTCEFLDFFFSFLVQKNMENSFFVILVITVFQRWN